VKNLWIVLLVVLFPLGLFLLWTQKTRADKADAAAQAAQDAATAAAAAASSRASVVYEAPRAQAPPSAGLADIAGAATTRVGNAVVSSLLNVFGL